MSATTFGVLLNRVIAGESLNAEDAGKAFGAIMAGDVDQSSIAALLTSLAKRKPTVAEIVGAARAMRQSMTTAFAPADAIDLCGTGGDGRGTLNISTASAFVVAGAGVPVAKHGNRGMSSTSGGADVLEALGALLDIGPEDASACLAEHGVCFLFAQRYHPAMKHAAPVRRALGFRTIFNLLGPISNPAGVTRQLVGVFDVEWVGPIAEALKQLGAQSAWVVHGSDGLDELTTTGPTEIAVLDGGTIRLRTITPEDAGLARSALADLRGGSPAQNAAAITRLLEGEKGAFRDAVLLNAAAALVIARRAEGLREGVGLAAKSLDSRSAKRALDGYVAFTRALAK